MKKPDLITKETPGQNEMDNQLDIIRGSIAEDLKLVNYGVVEGLKILSLDDKLYKRITDLLKPEKSQKSLSLPVADDKSVQEADVDSVKSTGNPFEAASKRVKAKINGAAR